MGFTRPGFCHCRAQMPPPGLAHRRRHHSVPGPGPPPPPTSSAQSWVTPGGASRRPREGTEGASSWKAAAGGRTVGGCVDLARCASPAPPAPVKYDTRRRAGQVSGLQGLSPEASQGAGTRCGARQEMSRSRETGCRPRASRRNEAEPSAPRAPRLGQLLSWARVGQRWAPCRTHLEVCRRPAGLGAPMPLVWVVLVSEEETAGAVTDVPSSTPLGREGGSPHHPRGGTPG